MAKLYRDNDGKVLRIANNIRELNVFECLHCMIFDWYYLQKFFKNYFQFFTYIGLAIVWIIASILAIILLSLKAITSPIWCIPYAKYYINKSKKPTAKIYTEEEMEKYYKLQNDDTIKIPAK